MSDSSGDDGKVSDVRQRSDLEGFGVSEKTVASERALTQDLGKGDGEKEEAVRRVLLTSTLDSSRPTPTPSLDRPTVLGQASKALDGKECLGETVEVYPRIQEELRLFDEREILFTGDVIGRSTRSEIYGGVWAHRREDCKLQYRTVSLKVSVPPDGAYDLTAELELLACSPHPHVALIYGWYETTALPYKTGVSERYLVVERYWCDLNHKIYCDGEFVSNPVKCLPIARDVAAGMAHIHGLGIRHGALSPASILLTPDGCYAKVAEFSRWREPNSVYTAPAVLQCVDPLPLSMDVWSFAMSMGEMLTSQPFETAAVTPAYLERQRVTLMEQLSKGKPASAIPKLHDAVLDILQSTTGYPTFQQILDEVHMWFKQDCQILNNQIRLRKIHTETAATAARIWESALERTPRDTIQKLTDMLRRREEDTRDGSSLVDADSGAHDRIVIPALMRLLGETDPQFYTRTLADFMWQYQMTERKGPDILFIVAFSSISALAQAVFAVDNCGAPDCRNAILRFPRHVLGPYTSGIVLCCTCHGRPVELFLTLSEVYRVWETTDFVRPSFPEMFCAEMTRSVEQLPEIETRLIIASAQGKFESGMMTNAIQRVADRHLRVDLELEVVAVRDHTTPGACKYRTTLRGSSEIYEVNAFRDWVLLRFKEDLGRELGTRVGVDSGHVLDQVRYANETQNRLTKRQHERLMTSGFNENSFVIFRGPAGCGKTFCALSQVADYLRNHSSTDGGILYISSTKAVADAFRLSLRNRAEGLLEAGIDERVRYLTGDEITDLNEVPAVDEDVALIVVDGAERFRRPSLRENIGGILEKFYRAAATRVLLLVDSLWDEVGDAKGTLDAFKKESFSKWPNVKRPVPHVIDFPREIVRCSQPISAAAWEFVKPLRCTRPWCISVAYGEPVKLFLCADESPKEALYAEYARHVVSALENVQTCLGDRTSSYRHTIVIVPDQRVRAGLVHSLQCLVPSPIVRVSERSQNADELVVDDLDSVDGTESLSVICVALDSTHNTEEDRDVREIDIRLRFYRALTRAIAVAAVINSIAGVLAEWWPKVAQENQDRTNPTFAIVTPIEDFAPRQLSEAGKQDVTATLPELSSTAHVLEGGKPVDIDGMNKRCPTLGEVKAACEDLRKVLQHRQTVHETVQLRVANAPKLDELVVGDLCHALNARTNDCLVTLELQYVDLTSKGAAALASALATLNELALQGNFIGDVGVEAIAKAWESRDHPKNLRRLNLSQNRIGNDGAFSLARLIGSGRSTLKELLLWKNRIDDVGLIKLAAGLVKDDQLEALDVGGNRIQGAGARALLGALRDRGGRVSHISDCILFDFNPLRNDQALQAVAHSGFKLAKMAELSVGRVPRDEAQFVLAELRALVICIGTAGGPVDGLEKMLPLLDDINLKLASSEPQPSDVLSSMYECVKLVGRLLSHAELMVSFKDSRIRAKAADRINQGYGEWRKVRMLIIGEARAGKTTLLQRLMGGSASAVPSTRGFETQDVVLGAKTVRGGGLARIYDFATSFGADSSADLTYWTKRLASRSTSDGVDLIANEIVFGTTPSLLHVSLQDPNMASEQPDNSEQPRNVLDDSPEQVHSEGSTRLDALPPSWPLRLQSRPVSCCVKELADEVGKLSSLRRRPAQVAAWDYGGHVVFHAVHHLSFVKDGLYIVVFNCRDWCDVGRKKTSMRNFECWLRSVARNTDSASLFVVGTHYFHHSSKLKMLSTRVDSIVERCKLTRCLQRHNQLAFWPLDNIDDPHENFDALKADVARCVDKELRANGMLLPDAWIEFSHEVQALRRGDVTNRKRIISRSQAHRLLQMVRARRGEEPPSKKELSVLLAVLANQGSISLFELGHSSDNLFLDPQWLMDSLTCVVRHFDWHRLREDFDAYVGRARSRGGASDPDLVSLAWQQWAHLSKRGILHVDLTLDLWPAERYSEHERKTLLTLMSDLRLIVGVKNKDRSFYVPSILPYYGSEEASFPLPKEAMSISFAFLPSGFFSTVVADMLHRDDCEPFMTDVDKMTVDNMTIRRCEAFLRWHPEGDLDLPFFISEDTQHDKIFLKLPQQHLDQSERLVGMVSSHVAHVNVTFYRGKVVVENHGSDIYMAPLYSPQDPLSPQMGQRSVLQDSLDWIWAKIDGQSWEKYETRLPESLRSDDPGLLPQLRQHELYDLLQPLYTQAEIDATMAHMHSSGIKSVDDVKGHLNRCESDEQIARLYEKLGLPHSQDTFVSAVERWPSATGVEILAFYITGDTRAELDHFRSEQGELAVTIRRPVAKGYVVSRERPIVSQLLDEHVKVIHFVAHGELDELDNDAANGVFEPSEFGGLDCSGIIILNFCEGGRVADHLRRIRRHNIVYWTGKPTLDLHCSQFTSKFYRKFVHEKPTDTDLCTLVHVVLNNRDDLSALFSRSPIAKSFCAAAVGLAACRGSDMQQRIGLVFEGDTHTVTLSLLRESAELIVEPVTIHCGQSDTPTITSRSGPTQGGFTMPRNPHAGRITSADVCFIGCFAQEWCLAKVEYSELDRYLPRGQLSLKLDWSPSVLQSLKGLVLHVAIRPWIPDTIMTDFANTLADYCAFEKKADSGNSKSEGFQCVVLSIEDGREIAGVLRAKHVPVVIYWDKFDFEAALVFNNNFYRCQFFKNGEYAKAFSHAALKVQENNLKAQPLIGSWDD